MEIEDNVEITCEKCEHVGVYYVCIEIDPSDYMNDID